MSMRNLLSTFCSLLACAGAVAIGAQPNIILVLVDDLGWGDMNLPHSTPKAEGTPRIEMPKLAEMAQTGLVLQRHYTAAPVCAPARASLFGGMHQGVTEVIRNNNFDAALENSHTLATVLKSAGYATALVGKWGIGGGNESGGTPETAAAWPSKRGFDFFFGYHNHLAGHRHYPKEESNADPDTHRNAVWENERMLTDTLDNCYTTDLFTARAKKWIVDHRAEKPEQPFFLALTLTAPHARLGIPSGAYPAGGGLNGGVQWLGTPGNMINTAASGAWDSFIHPAYVNNPQWEQYARERFGERAAQAISTAQRHATMVTRIDDAMGDLLQLCRDLKIDQNTFIVFTSDNGPHNEPGAVGGFAGHPAPAQNPAFFRSYGPFNGIKRDTWDGGLRVPCVVWGPGIVKNGSTSFPSQFHDWMATFADMAGVPVPMRSTGVSLLPLLRGEEDKQTFGTIYAEYNFGGGMAYYDDYAGNKRNRPRGEQQVIYFRAGDGRFLKAIRTGIKTGQEDFEIYDTQLDPAETTNLAADMPEMQEQLRAAVLQNRRAFGYAHDRTAGRRNNGISGGRCYDKLLIPANVNPEAMPGIQMRRVQASCAWVPEFDTLPGAAEAKSVIVSDPAAETLPAGSITEFRGYVNVPEDGNHWQFYVTLNDVPGSKAFLRMHRFPLVDADFNYPPGSTACSTPVPNAEEITPEAAAAQAVRGVPLKAGLHEIRLTVVQGESAQGKITIEWKKGHGALEKTAIPAHAYKH